MSIDDLYVDDEEDVVTQEPTLESTTVQEPEDDDFTSEVLKRKGIEDPSKIKFQEDDGTIVERNWDDLTREELLNILGDTLYKVVDNSEKLTDEEIEFINYLRTNNLTPNQYTQLFLQLATEPMYKVDELDDDDLFILDLESRVGELSDEDAAQALAVAKQNETLFKKQVDGIRNEYKEREDYVQKLEEASIEEQQRQAFELYANNVVDAIDSFNSIGNLDLNFEDSDKSELASFILSQDESGLNYLYQALQDPQTLVRAAWFILNGEKALDSIQDYFVNEIKLKSENQYKKGLEDGKNGTQTRVIINNKQANHRNYKTIDDLYNE